ncbi:hypothetical protein GCM10011339_21410 [Echinicola rosea]|uniref:DUF4160 domain-containing protein n=2 Tax=Echinicola rosea TaxID=1807691 RepID=A0ABQ1V1C0_9BACT|nr:hypothetical protein GCM10011339_21410 [Echinicola rosea]
MNAVKNFLYSKMPKIFEYLGIVLYFYSNEHEPVHVHATKSGKETKVSFIIKSGLIEEIIISNVPGRSPIKGQDLQNLKKFVVKYGDEIVTKWVDYFVYQRRVGFEKITTKLK